jgi:hypothetical protein
VKPCTLKACGKRLPREPYVKLHAYAQGILQSQKCHLIEMNNVADQPEFGVDAQFTCRTPSACKGAQRRWPRQHVAAGVSLRKGASESRRSRECGDSGRRDETRRPALPPRSRLGFAFPTLTAGSRLRLHAIAAFAAEEPAAARHARSAGGRLS